MAAKPSDVIPFATDATYSTGPDTGQPTKVPMVPADTDQGNIEGSGYAPSPQKFNWWQNLVGQWVDWLNENVLSGTVGNMQIPYGTVGTRIVTTKTELSFNPTTNVLSTSAAALGVLPAGTGSLRVPNGFDKGLRGRNEANDGDIDMIDVDSNDVVNVAGGSIFVIDKITGDITINADNVKIVRSNGNETDL